MGEPRAFPGLVNQLPGITQMAWERLYPFEKPFLTIRGNIDPGHLGLPETQQTLLDSIPGQQRTGPKDRFNSSDFQHLNEFHAVNFS